MELLNAFVFLYMLASELTINYNKMKFLKKRRAIVNKVTFFEIFDSIDRLAKRLNLFSLF